MNPDLEVVAIGSAKSFKAWEHGYPYRTVRWHFHPEYEIHHVVATTGQYFVGDFIGEFEPGNLVLTGPNLPHNWVSDVPPGTCLPLRCRVLQFSESFFADANKVFPELSGCIDILEISRRGVLFTPETAALVGPILGELVEAKGIRRIELFMNVLNALSCAQYCLYSSQCPLSPRSFGFHVGRREPGAGLYQHASDGAVQRSRSCGVNRAEPERVLTQFSPPHRHGARSICQPAADQFRLPPADERS